MGNTERRDITWINTDKNEILFAYPERLPQRYFSFTALFHQTEENNFAFLKKAEVFLKELRKVREPNTDPLADRINILILRKVDKARTKVVYTRQTNAFELEQCCERWHMGCKENLPNFPFECQTPFPLDAADILNRFWKQSGDPATDRFKPTPKYHGVELLMEPERFVISDLHRLTEQAMTIGGFLGSLSAKGNHKHTVWQKQKD